MKAPPCVGCGKPVLELRGQFAQLDSALIASNEPPAATAGTWHARCLVESGFGPAWRAAQLRSYELRGFQVVAETAGSLVLEQARTADRVALLPDGRLESLRFAAPGREVPGGKVFAVHEPEYNLEVDDATLIADLQAGLRRAGTYALRAVAQRLAIADRILHPELWDDAALRFDVDLAKEWGPHFVAAAAVYPVFVPDADVPYAVAAAAAIVTGGGMTVPAAIRSALKSALGPLSDHTAALPDPLPVGKVIHLFDPRRTDSREKIQILPGRKGNYYLDYYRVDDGSTSHGRIHPDGRVEALENYEGQFGLTVHVDPDATERERARVRSHNARVQAILRDKGFEG